MTRAGRSFRRADRWRACAIGLGIAAASLSGCKGESSEQVAEPASSADEAPPLTTSWQKPRDTLLSVGDEAPDFVALAHTGHQVELSTFLHRPSVVYFEPGLGGSEAVARAEGIRDAWLSLRDRIGMVLGVTPEDNVTHRAFASERDLPFLLVSDLDRAIAHSFGVALGDGPAANVAFVVGTDRKVLKVLEDVPPEGCGKQLVAAIEALSE